ncbi:MAG TPA: ThiF family adenylyltransferase [Candidatus Dormibacteraeota bacterium]|nr:ThiF family adenylyltransferase [Candidatus Dormibacteraeota bacterium]
MPEAEDVPWYERFPESVEWERDQFRRYGFTVDERIGDSGLVFEVDLAIGTVKVPVKVVYPPEFPEIHPTVYGPSPAMSRHQNPSELNFCLGGASETWLPTDSAASLVVGLVELLRADANGDAGLIHATEADMPEPVSVYLAAASTGTVLVPDPYWNADLPTDSGALRVGVVRSGLALLIGAAGAGDAHEAGAGALQYEAIEVGKWASIPYAPSALATNQELARLVWSPPSPPVLHRKQHRQRRPLHPRWLGLSYFEEGPQRDERRRNWIFLHAVGGTATYERYRSQALSLRERERRIPELTGFGLRSLLLIGAGSVGSSIGVELAKAGLGHITIVDDDVYDVNNSVRHPLPLIYAGTNKAEALSAYCSSINPFMERTSSAHRVGHRIAGQALRDLVAEADLCVDASGSGEVMRLLSRTCQQVGRPLLVAGLTSSSYGAEVVLGRPSGGCPCCFSLAQADGLLPTPESGPASNVTPVGCSQPTFFGAGFEATELAAVATRMVVAGCEDTGYPTQAYDWAVLNFRGEPHFQSGVLVRDDRCPYHK